MFYCYEDIKISLGECLQFYDKKNDGYSAGEIYVNLATEMMFQDCGEKNKIKEYFERAICYFAENSSKKLVYAKNNYAIYLIMVKKNITKGLNYLKEVLLVGLSDFTYMCLYLNICMCYILLGKTEDADFTDSYQRFHLAKKRLNKRRNATKYEDVYEDILNIIIAEQQGENVEKLCLTALGKLDNNSFFVPLLDDIVKRNCYLFFYYCRSTPPKSDSAFNKEDAEHMMKMKLGQYFMNKDYYFQKVRFDNDTKLMVSNRLYNSEVQFQWTNTNENIT